MFENPEQSKLEVWIQTHEELPAHSGRGIYSKQITADIASKHRITNIDHIDELWRQLELSSHWYLGIRDDLQNSHSNAENRKWLNKINKASEDLGNLISGPLGDPRNHCERHSILSGVEMSIWSEAHDTKSESFKQPEFTNIVDKDGHIPHLQNIERHLNLLVYVSSRALKNIPSNNPGPVSAYHLEVWINTLSVFWTEKLGREIKIDQVGNEFITEYGVFMSDCIQPLDSAPLQAHARPSLSSHLKKYRAARNKKRKR